MKTAFLLAIVVVSAGPLTAQTKPAGVPEGYVVTPFGYFHPSCVQTIAQGENLRPNGQIRHKDGSITGNTACSNLRACHPSGKPKVAGEPKTPEVSGWVESTNTIAPPNQAFSSILNYNVVPPVPVNNEGQYLYFFPGLEDTDCCSGNSSILQPVLAYHNGWYVSNWNCCLSGITTQSTPFNTEPGNTIISSMTENCEPGTLSCPTWNIFSYDLKTGLSTSLLNTPSDGQTFNWAFGAVLEPYYVNECADYPSKEETYNLLVFDQNFRPVKPTWTPSVNTSDTPQCGYGVTTQPYQNTLKYNSKPHQHTR